MSLLLTCKRQFLRTDGYLEMCNGKDHVCAMSKEFCLSNKYKYAMQVIEGFDDMLVTFNVQYQIANLLNSPGPTLNVTSC